MVDVWELDPDAALAVAGITPIASTAATHSNSLTNPLGITAGSKSSRAPRGCNYLAARFKTAKPASAWRSAA